LILKVVVDHSETEINLVVQGDLKTASRLCQKSKICIKINEFIVQLKIGWNLLFGYGKEPNIKINQCRLNFFLCEL
jgi:hypothetical protein